MSKIKISIMDKNTKERIIQENNELKEENERLKALLEEQQLKETNRNLKEENAELKKALNESDYETIDLSMEKEDAEILSLLNRSQKRLEVLESLEKEDKILSRISKDIHDSSYNISKYLKVLKEYDLVICLNESDKRYRYYRITPKGKKYLNIIKNRY